MTRWIALSAAAEVLGHTVGSLRKQFERRARRASDGAVEACVDGVRARTVAARWARRPHFLARHVDLPPKHVKHVGADRDLASARYHCQRRTLKSAMGGVLSGR